MGEGISRGRTHIVMVPGFAGFDALGQLEYYSGITPIFNTASMFWPNGADTRLLRADHGDIIGHFELAAAEPNSGRKYHTYDLLNSDSRTTFQRTTRERVWNDVFDFCVS